jgi:hypothetical protein
MLQVHVFFEDLFDENCPIPRARKNTNSSKAETLTAKTKTSEPDVKVEHRSETSVRKLRARHGFWRVKKKEQPQYLLYELNYIL